MDRETSDSPADVAVVGAGPAGMMAAIAAAQAGAKVVVCERLDRPGVKLLATGGGRCNLTNTVPLEAFMSAFGRQGRFMQPALSAMDSRALRAFFESLGVPTHSDDGVHVYPRSNSAATVRKALVRRCGELGVDIRLRCRVTGLRIEHGRLRGLEVGWAGLPTGFAMDSAGRPARPTCSAFIPAPRVVLAAGGKSSPDLGSDGSGFDLAAAAGHRIITPVPALVPLVTLESWARECAGVSLGPVRVWIDLPGHSRANVTGDVLFTHTGISGPAVLDLSGEAAALLDRRGTVPIRVAVLPGSARLPFDFAHGPELPEGQTSNPWRPQDWAGAIDQWGHDEGARTVRSLLSRHVPAAIAQVLCRLAGAPPGARAGQLSRPQRDALAEALNALPLSVTGTEGFERSMVTRGGVSLREADPRTLESRILPGLFLAGEVLDLAGPCGGYNLQWAFSSGHLAGLSAGGN